MRVECAKRLAGQNVTLAIDGGKVHHKLQSMSVICNKKAYYLTSVAVLHNDHETIFQVMQSNILLLVFLNVSYAQVLEKAAQREPLKLVKPVATRWNTVYDCHCRLVCCMMSLVVITTFSTG